MITTATTYAEIEIGLSGTFSRGYPETGPTYSCGGEPAEPDAMDGVEITGLFIDRRVSKLGIWTTEKIDLLSGVDIKHPIVQQILNNLLSVVDAEEVLLAEVSE